MLSLQPRLLAADMDAATFTRVFDRMMAKDANSMKALLAKLEPTPPPLIIEEPPPLTAVEEARNLSQDDRYAQQVRLDAEERLAEAERGKVDALAERLEEIRAAALASQESLSDALQDRPLESMTPAMKQQAIREEMAEAARLAEEEARRQADAEAEATPSGGGGGTPALASDALSAADGSEASEAWESASLASTAGTRTAIVDEGFVVRASTVAALERERAPKLQQASAKKKDEDDKARKKRRERREKARRTKALTHELDRKEKANKESMLLALAEDATREAAEQAEAEAEKILQEDPGHRRVVKAEEALKQAIIYAQLAQQTAMTAAKRAEAQGRRAKAAAATVELKVDIMMAETEVETAKEVSVEASTAYKEEAQKASKAAQAAVVEQIHAAVAAEEAAKAVATLDSYRQANEDARAAAAAAARAKRERLMRQRNLLSA